MATRRPGQAPGELPGDAETEAERRRLPPMLRFLGDRGALLRRLALAEILAAPLSRRPRRRLGPQSGPQSR